MHRCLWPVLLVVSACGPSEVDRFLGFPADMPAESLIFRTGRGDTTQFVGVDVADPGFRLEVGADDVMSDAVEVLTYYDSLAELGLERGVIPPATGEIGRPLPAPEGTFRLRLDGDQNVTWEAHPDMSMDAAAFRRKFCRPIKMTSERWAIDGSVRYVVPVDEEFVLMAVLDGGVARLFVSDGGPPTPARSDLVDNGAPFAAWRGPDDVIIYGDLRGRVYRGRLTREGILDGTMVFDFAQFSRVEAIDGHIEADGRMEIFVVTSDGSIAQGDGSTFTLVDGQATRSGGGIAEYRIMWRAPGEATIGFFELAQTAIVRNGRVMRDAAPPGVVFSMQYVPALGEVLGVQIGEFYTRRGDSAWRRLGPPYNVFPMAIVPREEGFSFLLAAGLVGRYHEPFGFCPVESVLPTLGFDGAMTAVGDDLFAIGELNSGISVTQGARVSF